MQHTALLAPEFTEQPGVNSPGRAGRAGPHIAWPVWGGGVAPEKGGRVGPEAPGP